MSVVLLIEDDQSIADMISIYLSEEQYTVYCAGDGAQARRIFQEREPDVVILDLVLPDTNGSDLYRSFRESSPCNALQLGADDYLCKPFSMRELAARTNALLRRAAMTGGTLRNAPAAEAKDAPHKNIVVDLEKRCIFLRNQPVDTTFSEFEIMKNFWLHPGKVFSREELPNKIRGIDSYVTERSVDVLITNLRKKVEADPKEPKHIKTVWGVGYKFEI